MPCIAPGTAQTVPCVAPIAPDTQQAKHTTAPTSPQAQRYRSQQFTAIISSMSTESDERTTSLPIARENQDNCPTSILARNEDSPEPLYLHNKQENVVNIPMSTDFSQSVDGIESSKDSQFTSKIHVHDTKNDKLNMNVAPGLDTLEKIPLHYDTASTPDETSDDQLIASSCASYDQLLECTVYDNIPAVARSDIGRENCTKVTNCRLSDVDASVITPNVNDHKSNDTQLESIVLSDVTSCSSTTDLMLKESISNTDDTVLCREVSDVDPSQDIYNEENALTNETCVDGDISEKAENTSETESKSEKIIIQNISFAPVPSVRPKSTTTNKASLPSAKLYSTKPLRTASSTSLKSGGRSAGLTSKTPVPPVGSRPTSTYRQASINVTSSSFRLGVGAAKSAAVTTKPSSSVKKRPTTSSTISKATLSSRPTTDESSKKTLSTSRPLSSSSTSKSVTDASGVLATESVPSTKSAKSTCVTIKTSPLKVASSVSKNTALGKKSLLSRVTNVTKAEDKA